MFRNKTKALGRVAVAVVLSMGLAVSAVSVASAAGTKANTITASTPPVAGSVHGSYTPTASATSGDQVVITLDNTSTGCSISGGRVSFTKSGTCRVDFNDSGNATYAAASQVQQSIRLYSANTIAASKAPAAGSAGGSYTPNASVTSGDQVVITLNNTSTGCSISGGKVSFIEAGTCRVDFNDAGNSSFAAASQVQQNIKVYSANTITASTSPAAGSVGGSYTPKASATSGDRVVITLDATSTGCSLTGGRVSFTGAGTCRVDFNDSGNGAFAAARQVQQSIIVGFGGHKTQATLTLTSTTGIVGHTLTLTSQGGSGTGAVSYAVTTTGTAGCSISGATLNATNAGTCTVTVTKAADVTYAVAHSSATTVTFTGRITTAPKAIKMGSAVWTGKSLITTIIGRGFYGQPRITSNVGGTRVGVLHDSGNTLTIRVTVAKGTPRGVHTFTIVFAHGQRTTVKYNQR